MSITTFIKNLLPRRFHSFAIEIRDSLIITKKYKQILKHRKNEHRNTDKLRIVFIVQRTEVFNSVRTVYENACRNAKCEVYLLPIPRAYNDRYEFMWESYKEIVDFCNNLRMGTVLECDEHSFVDLEKLRPDYVFLNVPYTKKYLEPYQIEKLSTISSVCYIPYGFSSSNERKFYRLYSCVLNNDLLGYCRYLFCDSEATKAFCQKRMLISELMWGKRLYSFGYPRFDLIRNENQNNNCRKTILWLPRWTSVKEVNEGNMRSTFFDYRLCFMEYFSKNSDCSLIIRPHPLAFNNYIISGEMTECEVNAYKNQIRTMKNVFLDEEPSYENSFQNADILIADYTSIIIEYFSTGRPIIYLGEKDDFSFRLSYVTDTFYYANDWCQVVSILNDILKGDDMLKSKRDIAVKRFKDHSCLAGKKIIDFLVDEWGNE